MSLHATTAASGSDIPVSLKFGDLESLSKPVGVKVMKNRTLHVTVYKVTKVTPGKPNNAPDLVPEESALQAYLNDIFKPQLNLSVAVKIEPAPLVVNWDTDPVDRAMDDFRILDPVTETDLHSAEQDLVMAEKNKLPEDGANIRLFILGGELPMGKLVTGLLNVDRRDGWGSTNRDQRTCWVMGDDPDQDTYKNSNGDPLGANTTENNYETYDYPLQFRTIAHEIGHMLAGPGHPDQTDQPGKAGLPGTDHTRRLMCSGKRKGVVPGTLLVKGEWDEAEIWLRNEEANQRL